MSSQVEKVISIYCSLSKIPTLTDATILKNGSSILSYWVQRNIETNKNSKIQFIQNIDSDFKVISDSGFGIDVSNELASVVSPLENLKAVINEQLEFGRSKSQYLEIWKNKQLKHSINLTALELHGDIYNDSEFGGFSWNDSEKCFIYVAEKKLPKSEPFYQRQPLKSQNKIHNYEQTSRGKEYEYKPEWGEQLVGKHLSSIIICEIEKETCKVVEGIPVNWCPGQVQWSPGGLSIVGVAWETEPRRLGLIFCTNRLSIIFNITLDGKFSIISKIGKAVRSPRFSSDGKHLIWLQRDIGGPHHDCHQLVKTDWPLTDKPAVRTVIDLVDNEITIEKNVKFTGLYNRMLPKRAFATDGKRVLFSTPQQTEVHSYVVDIDTGKIIDISDKSIPCSTSIIEIYKDTIIAWRTSFKLPTQLMIAKLPKIDNETTIKWVILDENNVEISDIIINSNIEIMSLKHENTTDSVNNFSALFFSGTSNGSVLKPLIINPHGGPQSSFVNGFNLELALYCILGFSIVQVNFRGSIGAGRNSLQFLPGKTGNADVKDCILAVEQVIKQFPIDEHNCFLLGRSYGGFLVTHLSGQYPQRFRAVVAGNPVIDIASKENTTDIPDLCLFTVGFEFNEFGPANESSLIEMRRASPLVNSHNVKAPTLLCLGSNDKRVSSSQGIEYYNKIKANGCKARLLIYEDNHSLTASKNIEMNHIINCTLWFLEHLK